MDENPYKAPQEQGWTNQPSRWGTFGRDEAIAVGLTFAIYLVLWLLAVLFG